MSYIPVLDLADYLSGDEARRQKFIQGFGKAYSGIPQPVIDKYYGLVEQFYALPVEKKLDYEKVEYAGQRGYTSFGREKAKQSEVADLKEFWQVGQYIEDGEVMPADDVNYFDPRIHNGNSILRAIHYPPITQEPKSAIRAEAHEDINLITLLVGASASGLQVQDVDGTWHEAQASPSQIMVNVGDMLQRLCNNKLKSTTHRVVNPPRELWHTHRYSILLASKK